MILDLFFPNRCSNCNRIIDANNLVCNLCYQNIHFTHYDFYEEHILKERCKLLFPVEHAFALMQFDKENLSRKIIHELKYRNREIVGKIIADWVTNYLNFSEDKPEIMVTVPLHPKKEKERGYNQLHLFAKDLSSFYNIPLDNNLVVRNYYSQAQALKNKKHRLENKNMFSVTQKVNGKHILLVDDVFTTGNTLSSIAWEFLNSGNRVSILVMAMDE